MFFRVVQKSETSHLPEYTVSLRFTEYVQLLDNLLFNNQRGTSPAPPDSVSLATPARETDAPHASTVIPMFAAMPVSDNPQVTNTESNQRYRTWSMPDGRSRYPKTASLSSLVNPRLLQENASPCALRTRESPLARGTVVVTPPSPWMR